MLPVDQCIEKIGSHKRFACSSFTAGYGDLHFLMIVIIGANTEVAFQKILNQCFWGQRWGANKNIDLVLIEQ